MFLVRFLTSNIFSIILVCFILLLKKVLKSNLSLKFHYHIWFVLLFSLIIVFFPTLFFQFGELENIANKVTISSNEVLESINLNSNISDDWKYDFIELTDNSNNILLKKY